METESAITGFPQARAVVVADQLKRTPCGWELEQDRAFLDLLDRLRAEFAEMAIQLAALDLSSSLRRLAQPIFDRLRAQ